jgi:hypothetical protein
MTLATVGIDGQQSARIITQEVADLRRDVALGRPPPTWFSQPQKAVACDENDD